MPYMYITPYCRFIDSDAWCIIAVTVEKPCTARESVRIAV